LGLHLGAEAGNNPAPAEVGVWESDHVAEPGSATLGDYPLLR